MKSRNGVSDNIEIDLFSAALVCLVGSGCIAHNAQSNVWLPRPPNYVAKVLACTQTMPLAIDAFAIRVGRRIIQHRRARSMSMNVHRRSLIVQWIHRSFALICQARSCADIALQVCK